MSAGAFIPRRVRHWRDNVVVYDLGPKHQPPRPFLKLDLEEQALVVARIAMNEHRAKVPVPDSASSDRGKDENRATGGDR